MVLVVYGFWKLGSYYATMAGFSALYPVFTVTRFVFLALFAVLTALAIVLRAPLAGSRSAAMRRPRPAMCVGIRDHSRSFLDRQHDRHLSHARAGLHGRRRLSP